MDWDSEFNKFSSKIYNFQFGNEKNKNTIIVPAEETGSYSVVYTKAFDETETLIAIKISKHQTHEDNLNLFSEYTIHKRLYDKYVETKRDIACIKPLWLRWITFNGGEKTLAMGLERLETTMYHRLRRKGPKSILPWKTEILKEIEFLNTNWNFFHRDLHLKNVGVLNDTWILFDFGMAMFDDLQPYPGEDVFYKRKETPSIKHDERIFRFSWSNHVQGDPLYLKDERKKIKESDCNSWETNMPIMFKDSKKATFLYIENGCPVIELRNNLKRKRLYASKDKICPDLTDMFIQYYIPTLL